MLSLCCIVLGSVMMLVAPNYALLLVSRVILAIGAGVFNVIGFSVVAGLATGAIATLMMGYNAALILGLPMGRVLSHAFGWKSIFLATGIAGLIAILVVAWIIPSQKAQETMPLGKQLAYIKSPKVLLTFGITFFWIAGYSVLYSYITPFLLAVSPMSDRLLSLVLFAFGLATLAGNKVGGLIGDRFGTERSLRGSMVVHAMILVLLSTIAGPIFITIPLLILWAVAAWTPAAAQQYNIITLAPEASSVMMSLNNSVLQLAFASGAAIGGIAVQNAAKITLSWTGAVFVVVAIGTIWASFRHPEDPAKAQLK